MLLSWFSSLLGHIPPSRIGYTLNLLFGSRKETALCNTYLPWTYKCSFGLKIYFLAWKVYLLVIEITQLLHEVILPLLSADNRCGIPVQNCDHWLSRLQAAAKIFSLS